MASRCAAATFVDCANNRGEIAWNEWCPPDRRHGFADWYSYGTYDQHMRPLYWDTQAPRDGFHYVDTWGPEHEADQAIAFLKGQRDDTRPFALVVAMNPPHTSYKEVPQHLLAEQQGRELLIRGNIDHAALDSSKAQPEAEAYFAMVHGVDEQVGRILATLAEEGLADDTLVLFTADHGCCLHSHAQGFKNVPWDESILIPFLLRFPGRVAPRIDHDCVLSVPDIMPTVLGLLGYRAEIPAGVQGRDLSAWCGDGSGTAPTVALYQQIDVADHSAGPRGLRTRDHLFLAQPDGTTQLFDSRSDPYQVHDISALQPALVGQFQTDLRLELQRAGDPWPG